MSSVSVPRRFALLMLIGVASFVVFKCSSLKYNQNREVFCRSGNYSESHPLICIDERNLTANPSRARVYDTESKNLKSTGRPVTIHWFAQRTADIRIEMHTSGCTERVTCDGLGHCWTTTKKLGEREREKVCTYGIMIGDKTIDDEADIVLVPCCY